MRNAEPLEPEGVTKTCPKCGHHLRYHVRGVPVGQNVLRTSAHHRTCRRQLGFNSEGRVLYCNCIVED